MAAVRHVSASATSPGTIGPLILSVNGTDYPWVIDQDTTNEEHRLVYLEGVSLLPGESNTLSPQTDTTKSGLDRRRCLVSTADDWHVHPHRRYELTQSEQSQLHSRLLVTARTPVRQPWPSICSPGAPTMWSSRPLTSKLNIALWIMARPRMLILDWYGSTMVRRPLPATGQCGYSVLMGCFPTRSAPREAQ